MTDERISNAFEQYLNGPIDTDATMFGYHYETTRKGDKTGYKNMAQGFYAGFRAAERLAKIEVLEWFKGKYGRKENSINHCAIDAKVLQTDIDSMLSDLKGEL